jgi:hypothetical protein
VGKQKEQSKEPVERKAGVRWGGTGLGRWLGSIEASEAGPIEDRERALEREERMRLCQLPFECWLPLREDEEAR